MVLMPSGVVMRATARIIGTGPTASTKVNLASGGDQLFQFFCHQPLLAVAAVVGHHVGLIARAAHFVFKDDHLFRCARLQ